MPIGQYSVKPAGCVKRGGVAYTTKLVPLFARIRLIERQELGALLNQSSWGETRRKSSAISKDGIGLHWKHRPSHATTQSSTRLWSASICTQGGCHQTILSPLTMAQSKSMTMLHRMQKYGLQLESCPMAKQRVLLECAPSK